MIKNLNVNIFELNKRNEKSTSREMYSLHTIYNHVYTNYCKNNMFSNNENKRSVQVQYIIVISTQCHIIHKN